LDPGLTIAQSAKVEGDLNYRQSRELSFPAGVVAGEVTRRQPAAAQETTGERLRSWGVDVLRTSITLILAGLFLLWLFPLLLQEGSLKLQSAVLPSLGWGLAAYIGFFLVLLLILFVVIAGGLLLAVLTLSGLAGAVIGAGILSLFALVLGFVFITAFVAKIIFGQALGRWLLARLRSPLAGRRPWTMVIGVVIMVVLVALFRLPPIPSFLGGVLNFAVILSGLGAFWLWARERLVRRSAAP
jgi:hypothetical protein